jgi:glycosyltransferase involved in cell wall biosynthesis
MSNTKILYIIDSLGEGGAEKLLLLTLQELTQHEKHLIILSKPDTLVEKIPSSCKVSTLDFSSYKDIPRISRFVSSYIKQNQIDIVHSHLYYSNVIARLATPRNIPVFNTIHSISSLASYQVNRMTLYMEKLTYRKRHHIICVSNEVLKDFNKWVGLKGASSVLYNFIDDVFFRHAPKTEFSTDKFRFVAVGNLRYEKNYPYILNAFKSMPDSVSLDVYGEGTLRDELQKEIDTYKLNIRLCGTRNNMHEVLPQYDAFLMSSFFEGQPVALLEAMASGLPVFLSDIPVLHEVAQDNAVYFDLNNPQDLVNKIKQVLNRNIDLNPLARQAHARANAIAWKSAHINKLNAIYEQHRIELLSSSRTGNKKMVNNGKLRKIGLGNLPGQPGVSTKYFKQ